MHIDWIQYIQNTLLYIRIRTWRTLESLHSTQQCTAWAAQRGTHRRAVQE